MKVFNIMRVFTLLIFVNSLRVTSLFSEKLKKDDIYYVPYIGKVRRVYSGDKPTKYHVPIIEDPIVYEKVRETQEVYKGRVKEYVELLQKEEDPDMRREWLEILSKFSSEEAEVALDAIIAQLSKEEVPAVRAAALYAISGLLSNGTLTDEKILYGLDVIRKYLTNDVDDEVRVGAANVLLYYGEDKETILPVILEHLQKKQYYGCKTCFWRECIPYMLLRIGGEEAMRSLQQISDNEKEDVWVRVNSIDALVQSGKRNVKVDFLTNVATTHENKFLRMRALTTLFIQSKDNPQIREKILTLYRNEKDNFVKKHLEGLIQQYQK
jgi:HEAT repeat protein